MSFDVSVIVPAYNRLEPLLYTLESVRRASRGVAVETILVDDGSAPPLAEQLGPAGSSLSTILRQPNRGLLFARLAGLAEAHGRYVLFLDSDDLVSREKLGRQVSAMDRLGLDASYTATARCRLEGEYDHLQERPDPLPLVTSDWAELHIHVQPAPHSLMYRTTYLRDLVAAPAFPPTPLYNSVAEIWFYHLAAVKGGRGAFVDEGRAIIGEHGYEQITVQWEKLAVASLAVMEAFVCHTESNTAGARRARGLVGERAFTSWRRLPYDFSADYQRRLLTIWRVLTGGVTSPRLGGPVFQALARLMGPVAAARVLRRLRGHSYATCRTVSDDAFRHLLAQIPRARLNSRVGNSHP